MIMEALNVLQSGAVIAAEAGGGMIAKKGLAKLMTTHYGPAQQICVELGAMGITTMVGSFAGLGMQKTFEQIKTVVETVQEQLTRKEEPKNTEEVAE